MVFPWFSHGFPIETFMSHDFATFDTGESLPFFDLQRINDTTSISARTTPAPPDEGQWEIALWPFTVGAATWGALGSWAIWAMNKIAWLIGYEMGVILPDLLGLLEILVAQGGKPISNIQLIQQPNTDNNIVRWIQTGKVREISPGKFWSGEDGEEVTIEILGLRLNRDPEIWLPPTYEDINTMGLCVLLRWLNIIPRSKGILIQ